MPRIELSKRLLLLATVSLLSSCASLTPKPPPAPPTPTAGIERGACEVWKPIYFDRLHDTVQTIQQAKANNAAREAFCGAT